MVSGSFWLKKSDSSILFPDDCSDVPVDVADIGAAKKSPNISASLSTVPFVVASASERFNLFYIHFYIVTI